MNIVGISRSSRQMRAGLSPGCSWLFGFVAACALTLNLRADIQDGSQLNGDSLSCDNPTKPYVIVTGGGTICAGGSITLTAMVIGGTSPFTYHWSPGGGTTASITVSPSATTTYTIRVTSASGSVSDPVSVTVSVIPAPDCSIVPLDGSQVCPGGLARFRGPDGMAKYTWSIADNGVINGPVNAQTVQVKAGPGCGTSFTLTLTCQSAEGSTGASPGVEADTGAEALTCQPTGGCTSTCHKTISITDLTGPIIQCPASITVDCNALLDPAHTGLATASDSCSGVVQPLTFTDVTTAGNCPGKYTIARTWTATDNCGNKSTCTQTITVQDTTAPVLHGVPADATVQCDAVPVPPAVTATDNCDPNPVVILKERIDQGNCPANYTLTRTWTATDACGNQTSASQTITVKDTTKPAVTCPGDIVTCGPKATFQATASDTCGTATVACTRADLQPLSADYPVGTTLVTCTATDACGNQSAPCSFNVIVLPPTKAGVLGNPSGCLGSSFTFQETPTGAGPFAVSWSMSIGGTVTALGIGDPGVTIDTASVPGSSILTINTKAFNNGQLLPGTYNVIANITGQCGLASVLGTLTINPLPVVTVGSAEVCEGVSAVFTAQVNGSTATPFQFSWVGPSGTGPFGNTPSITVKVPGTYTVTVTDANNCVGTGSALLTVDPKPTVQVGSILVCQNGSGTLTAAASGGTGSYTYSWTGPSGTGPFPSANSITVSVPGIYFVTVKDSKGCTAVASGNMTFSPKPVVTLTNPSICQATAQTLTATVAQSTASPFHYVWTGPAGTGPFADSSSIQVSVGGTYAVTVTDANGCSGMAVVTLNLHSLICSVAPDNCLICAGQESTLTVTAFGTPPFTYQWSNGATTPSIRTGKAGVYSVVVADANGCSTTCSGEVIVDTFGCVSCGVVPDSGAICNGAAVTLSGLHLGGMAPFQYLWNTGETTSTIMVTHPGIYTLSVIDANGCAATFSTTVESCSQCVTRDAAYWSSHIVPPPRASLPPGVSCAVLEDVFKLLPNQLMNLGFMQVNLNQALGLFWGNPIATSDGIESDLCITRKRLSIELISAIANVKLLNADSSRCGVQDPITEEFILISTLIQEAQAATQAEPNLFDCSTQTAWINEMSYLAALLNIYNAGGLGLALPSNLVDCGVGAANANYIRLNQMDPTTGVNCACPNP